MLILYDFTGSFFINFLFLTLCSLCLCGFTVFNDYSLGNGIVVVMRETEKNFLCPLPPPNFPRLTRQLNFRLPQATVGYLYLFPVHSLPQGLPHCLLGRKAGRKMNIFLSFSPTVAYLKSGTKIYYSISLPLF